MKLVLSTLAVDGWAVTFGTVRRGMGGVLLAAPNVTAHPSTASVPIVAVRFNVPVKGLNTYWHHRMWDRMMTINLLPWHVYKSSESRWGPTCLLCMLSIGDSVLGLCSKPAGLLN